MFRRLTDALPLDPKINALLSYTTSSPSFQSMECDTKKLSMQKMAVQNLDKKHDVAWPFLAPFFFFRVKLDGLREKRGFSWSSFHDFTR